MNERANVCSSRIRIILYTRCNTFRTPSNSLITIKEIMLRLLLGKLSYLNMLAVQRNHLVNGYNN